MAQTRSILIRLSHINYLLHTFSSDVQNFIFHVKIFFSYLSYTVGFMWDLRGVAPDIYVGMKFT